MTAIVIMVSIFFIIKVWKDTPKDQSKIKDKTRTTQTPWLISQRSIETNNESMVHEVRLTDGMTLTGMAGRGAT
eukprot:6122978-Amphidinium_carterae.1